MPIYVPFPDVFIFSGIWVSLVDYFSSPWKNFISILGQIISAFISPLSKKSQFLLHLWKIVEEGI